MTLTKFIAGAVFAVAAIGVQAAAQHAIPERSDDPRMRYIDYVPKTVTTVNVYPGFMVHMVFGQGEKVQRFHTGLGRGYFIRTTQNGIMLRPNGKQPATNLIVQTNSNTYYFDLVADAAPPELKPSQRHLNQRLVYRIGLREHQQVQAAWLKEQSDRALAMAEAQSKLAQAGARALASLQEPSLQVPEFIQSGNQAR